MTIDIAERYKLILAEHHYASDFRVKIFTGWCAIYAALAAVFAWVHTKSPQLTWIIYPGGRSYHRPNVAG